jgi:inorganic pyrophosphatase/exopolyphosphatase
MRRGKAKKVNDSKIFDYGGKKVSIAADDSDTLQILDESDREWVRLWQNATSKEDYQTIGLTTTFFSPEETVTKSLQTKTRS